MADLPAERVTPARPFSNCGIDFAGPFTIKNKSQKTEKIYIAIFVCMSTKAVHMELVSSLTKEDCIFALTQFISRRVMPQKIFSDNGSNFLGARKDLIKLKILLDKSDKENSLINFVNQRSCEWLTIPPRAPHFGGLWEAAIKSMERHMRRVIGLHILSYEEFQTVIDQIEAILNSRPLVTLSNDPNDTMALTPAHFLIGDTMNSLPKAERSNMDLTSRFRLLKVIQEKFWKSWKRDYLTELQMRKKWLLKGPEIAIGDLVLLAEDNEAPLQWKIGRVTEVYKGNDNIVRVCKVKTQNSSFMRPVVKLRKLPITTKPSVPSINAILASETKD